MAQEFVVQGRIVAGHPGKLRPKKDARTRQAIIKDGQPVQQIYFGLAVAKADFDSKPQPNGLTIRQMLENEAKVPFPNGVPPVFSWKYKDGDGIDGAGKPYSSREGYAGHYVINFTTEGFAPQLFKQEIGANGVPVYRQLSPEDIKCGDYVAVKTTVKFNNTFSPNTPGLYVNPSMVLHIGYGQEIVSSGQDPDEAFAGFQAALPAGASATPIMHGQAPTAAPAAPAAYVPAPAPVATPAPAAYVPPAPLPAPAHDFVAAVIAPPAPFPPAGWTAHPSAPGYFYMGREVLSEQQLRERAATPGMPAPR